MMIKGKLANHLDREQPLPPQEPRNYIGASLIGSDCLRAIWYEYKDFPATVLPKRVVRIFETGKRLESMLIEMLEMAGFALITPSEENNYLEYCDKEFPFLKGHADAVIKDLDAILEIKTAKDSSFKKFIKEGVKEWMPRYYAQLQAYMGMSGLHKAYILVLNKDNSEVCDEEVSYDDYFYHRLKERAEMIYNAVVPPPRIGNTPLWYQCRTCKFKEECYQ